nr:AzlC family ABC transporter permease [Rhizobium sp. 2MFCol3.1]
MYSSPLQIILSQNINDGFVLVPVILALNARFALMTASLMPYLYPKGGFRPIFWVHLLVPSVLSVCLSAFRRGHPDPVRYYRVMATSLFITVAISTGLGVLVSKWIPGLDVKTLVSFALALLFVAQNARAWPNMPDFFGFWAGLVVMPIALWIDADLAMLVAPIIIGGLMALSLRNGKRQ